MLHLKLLLSTCIGVIACLVKGTSTSTIVVELPKSNVTALNKKFEADILKRITNRLVPLLNIIESTKTKCENAKNSQEDECLECGEDCKKEIQLKMLMTMIMGPLYLQVEVIQLILTEATKTLEMFGKESYDYLKTVGNIGQQVGSFLLRASDKVLQETGKSLTKIGEQIEENSKKLLKDSVNGLQDASNEVVNAVKTSFKEITDLGKPIMEKTTKMLNEIGKVAGQGFENLGKNVGEITDITFKSLSEGAKIIENGLPKINLPKIDLPKLELPKINLPRIRLPRINLPRIRLPRINLPRLPSFRAPRVRLGWGKKRRSSTKLLECECPACEPFNGKPTVSEITERICGKSHIANQARQMKESYSLNRLYNFIINPTNTVLSKVLLYLRSTGFMSFAVEKTTMVLNTPNNKSIELTMQKGIPSALNDTHIENIITEEAAEVYRILLKESV